MDCPEILEEFEQAWKEKHPATNKRGRPSGSTRRPRAAATRNRDRGDSVDPEDDFNHFDEAGKPDESLCVPKKKHHITLKVGSISVVTCNCLLFFAGSLKKALGFLALVTLNYNLTDINLIVGSR
jgi:hypothetical protein